MAVLYSSLDSPDWPDALDQEAGIVTYYGDNKRPGRDLHSTPKGGNELLRFSFDAIHSTPARREDVPPFFLFTQGVGWPGREVRWPGRARWVRHRPVH